MLGLAFLLLGILVWFALSRQAEAPSVPGDGDEVISAELPT